MGAALEISEGAGLGWGGGLLYANLMPGPNLCSYPIFMLLHFPWFNLVLIMLYFALEVALTMFWTGRSMNKQNILGLFQKKKRMSDG